MNKANIKIEINKERNSSELISFAFRFFKDNIRIIFLSNLCFAIPLIIISLASFVVLVLDVFDGKYLDTMLMIFDIFGVLTLILLYASANSIVINYIQIDNPKKMQLSHVWAKMQTYLWQYLVLGGLVVLLKHIISHACSEATYIVEGILKLVSVVLIIGFLFTSLYSGIITLCDKYSLAKSWLSSFKLMKKYLWETLGFLLLYGVIGSVVLKLTLPLFSLEFIDVDFYLEQEYYFGIDSDIIEEFILYVPSLVLCLILILFTCFLFSAFTIAIAMKYFSLKNSQTKAVD